MKASESVRAIMRTHLITFKPDLEIRQAVKILIRNQISGAPVVDEKGKLLGMLSEKDCISMVLSNSDNQIPGSHGIVSEFMTPIVKTISANKTILDAAYMFCQEPFRRFPVIDNGKIVGQISRRDVLVASLKFRSGKKHVPSSWKGREPQF